MRYVLVLLALSACDEGASEPRQQPVVCNDAMLEACTHIHNCAGRDPWVLRGSRGSTLQGDRFQCTHTLAAAETFMVGVLPILLTCKGRFDVTEEQFAPCIEAVEEAACAREGGWAMDPFREDEPAILDGLRLCVF